MRGLPSNAKWERNMEIVHKWTEGASTHQLGREYGISAEAISKILKNTNRRLIEHYKNTQERKHE